ncbi:hypothetical protein [Pedobacter yonginense]|uniref:hypothetical protein n=1 Tax=Pedobacter yonginense TaxID=651869 RepID=UPI001403E3F6|nr:hypothetical protein [Pedobacter yonginense]
MFALAIIFSTFASRFGGNGRREERLRGIKNYFEIVLGEGEKVLTFATRFGKNGKPLRGGEVEGMWREEAGRKNKNILFGSSEKIPTFALPTERKGKKDRNGGCREGDKRDTEARADARESTETPMQGQR